MTPLELIATFLTAAMFLSNITLIYEFKQAGSTGNSSPIPFIATFINCSLWMKYGLLLDEFPMYSVNAFGLFVISLCLYFYSKYTNDRTGFENYLLGGLLLVISILAYVRLCYTWVPNMMDHLGFMTCGFTILMFASPLLSLSAVLRTKSSLGHISLPVACLSLVVCVLWVVLGLRMVDNFVIIPNAIGAALSLLQVLVYLAYKPMSKLHILPTKLNMEQSRSE